MKFVKADDLKIGMRLAKPIYNNKGVLLYDRNSKLTSQGIESVRNFNLIGLYVLEPAEPLPPMSEDDIEFEKFQMVSVFTVKEELLNIHIKGKSSKLYTLAERIVSKYGRLDHKINFIQNLRSADDFIYKHSLNVAILTAMIMNQLKARPEEKIEAVMSALVHDVGKMKVDSRLLLSNEIDDVQKMSMRAAQYEGIGNLDNVFYSSPNVKRAALQAYKTLSCYEDGKSPDSSKLVLGAKALCVADMYDQMTAMNSDGEPKSEVVALRLFRNNSNYFDKDAVEGLIKSINILAEGCCVELSNGEKALVISSNASDILRPMVLCFSSNTVVDLAQTMLYSDLEIADIMKTLDNRHVMGSVDENASDNSDNPLEINLTN